MKHQALCIALGIGVAAIAVSCMDRTGATKPMDDGMAAAAKGNPGPESLEFDGTIGKIDGDKDDHGTALAVVEEIQGASGM